jgi:hypothetical protein
MRAERLAEGRPLGQIDESAVAHDQPKAARNDRFYRMTIEGIPLRPCAQFSSFGLQGEPDWRERVSLLCWPRLKVQKVCSLRRSGT